MFALKTLISYHTEAFVKTEVGCTVANFFYVLLFSLKCNCIKEVDAKYLYKCIPSMNNLQVATPEFPNKCMHHYYAV